VSKTDEWMARRLELRRRLYNRVIAVGAIDRTALCEWSGNPEMASWEVDALLLRGNLIWEVTMTETTLRVGPKPWATT